MNPSPRSLDPAAAISCYGPARATVAGEPLGEEELRTINDFWRACCYLALGMIYLRDNPLLREPLRPEHIKNRLLGHWGSSPGQAFIYSHLNRVIRNADLDMIYLSGPGHGAPGVIGPVYLEGSYSEIYPEKSQDEQGMLRLFKSFSFPGGIGSHCTPELPGSIHEGGELGYVLAHACGAAFDNPDLVVAAVVGDGESETATLATSWHINKFLNPARDGAVLPILHLNGYKINNPTLLSRITHEELDALFHGYGWTPYFVEGSDPQSMHQAMAATLDHCVAEIKRLQAAARDGATERPRWPMIVLRSPKGWTAPRQLDGHYLEGFWRAHQVPIPNAKTDAEDLRQLEEWMRSYRPDELFDEHGTPIEALRALTPTGQRRMGSNPHANGGLLRKDLVLPDFRDHAVPVAEPGKSMVENVRPLGGYLRDVMRSNMRTFRVLGPDETTSNKLDAVYEAAPKLWLEARIADDADGGELSREGRVLEMLSENMMEGMLEGYVLTGRHGMWSTYESFAHVVDSMFNQHAKWLETAGGLQWRADIASINMLITSTVWRQDHNGFTHQEPGFIDVVTNKSPSVTRIYLPPDVNCLLSVADHCLRSKNYFNVIVSDKQQHLQYLDMDAAIEHCTKGVGIWPWASNDAGVEPDLVMACAGDIPTQESLAATALLRQHFPDLKVRFVNIVDLFRLVPSSEHPHGLADRDFDMLFTRDKPVILNFHGYPWLIHKLTYRRANSANIHVRGYKERGSINTPLQLAIENNVDRFSLVMDAIDRVPVLQATGAHTREAMRNEQIAAVQYAREHGSDHADYAEWVWPY